MSDQGYCDGGDDDGWESPNSDLVCGWCVGVAACSCAVGETTCAMHGRDEGDVAEVGRVRGIAPKSVSKVVRMCRHNHTLRGHDNHPTRDRQKPS